MRRKCGRLQEEVRKRDEVRGKEEEKVGRRKKEGVRRKKSKGSPQKKREMQTIDCFFVIFFPPTFQPNYFVFFRFALKKTK